MDDSKEKSIKEHVISVLKEKAVLKQNVYDQTKKTLKIIKKITQEIAKEYDKELASEDERVLLEYRDRGMFEAELKIAGDLIIFNMHSNVFEFPRNHEIWKDNYFVQEPLLTYSGIINIYNFLADSFKYYRMDDLGYLIGRIFVNKDCSFFVEGRRELGFNYPAFGKNEVNEINIRTLIENTMAYVLKFDLLVPPYNEVKIITVRDMQEKMNKHKMQTGKRLGFQYNAIE